MCARTCTAQVHTYGLPQMKHRGFYCIGNSPLYCNDGYVQSVCKLFLFNEAYSAKLDMIRFQVYYTKPMSPSFEEFRKSGEDSACLQTHRYQDLILYCNPRCLGLMSWMRSMLTKLSDCTHLYWVLLGITLTSIKSLSSQNLHSYRSGRWAE